jgi:hypothetical protein
VDRDALGRAQRRRLALEALEFERERVTSLEEQVGAIIAEVEGPRIDEETFARMAPEDVDVVRRAFRPEEPAADEDWLELVGEPPEDDAPEPEDDPEEEIARLQQEIAASRRRQEALERYIEALRAGAAAESGAGIRS